MPAINLIGHCPWTCPGGSVINYNYISLVIDWQVVLRTATRPPGSHDSLLKTCPWAPSSQIRLGCVQDKSPKPHFWAPIARQLSEDCPLVGQFLRYAHNVITPSGAPLAAHWTASMWPTCKAIQLEPDRMPYQGIPPQNRQLGSHCWGNQSEHTTLHKDLGWRPWSPPSSGKTIGGK